MNWGISLIRCVLVFLLSSQRHYKYGVEADESITTSGIMDKLKWMNRNLWMEISDCKIVTFANVFNIVSWRKRGSKYIHSFFLTFGTTWGLMLAPGCGIFITILRPLCSSDRSPSKAQSLSESCVEAILFTHVNSCVFISEWIIYRRFQ
jgi:hypothetical protein